MTSNEECNSQAAFLDGISIPRLPNLSGRVNNVHSKLLSGGLPIRTGSRVERRVSSSTFSKGSTSGMVRLKYVHLLINPCVRTEKAGWDWVAAVVARHCMLDIHALTFDSTCLVTYS